jgi:methyl-accepting chemotaxis protein-2 (aspartate sensor receptor)
MVRLLHNLRINTAALCAILAWVLLFGVITGLVVMETRTAQGSMSYLSDLSVAQLNEVNSAEAVLNRARLNLEAGYSYLSSDRAIQAERRLEEALAMLGESEAAFSGFMAVPKTEAAEALAQQLQSDYQEVLSLVQEQHQSLLDGNLEDFDSIREELMPLSDALSASLEAFFMSAEESIATELTNFDAQIQKFTIVGAMVLGVVVVILILMFFSLRAMIVKPMTQAVENLNHIANADLSHEVQEMGRNEIGQMFSAMRRMQENLAGIVTDVRYGSDSIHVGATEIASGNADLSSRTEQQASSLEETAASMEQLTTTVKQNADNARQASTLARDASTTASRGGTVVEQVISTMRGIADGSRKIADITGLIDSIAFQTNILALNASVEAARAGEQGRGFAVVAGEVRNLAGRSADAAKEIKQLIDAAVQQVQEGSTLVEQAGTTMQEVVASVKRVTDIVDEISAASQEQSGGIEQVSKAVNQMDEVTQRNAALVQETAAAAASLEEQAKRLEQVVAVFRLAGAIVATEAQREDASMLQTRPAGGAQARTHNSTQSPQEKPGAGALASGTSPKPVLAARRDANESEWEAF